MEKKLPYNSKSQYKAETIKRCSIDRTWLIEYNHVILCVKLISVPELIHNGKEIDV